MDPILINSLKIESGQHAITHALQALAPISHSTPNTTEVSLPGFPGLLVQHILDQAMNEVASNFQNMLDDSVERAQQVLNQEQEKLMSALDPMLRFTAALTGLVASQR